MQNPWKLALTNPKAASLNAQPRVPGHFVSLRDEEEQLVLEMTPYTPAKLQAKMANRQRKAKLQKELKAYLMGRGPRPEFLPKASATKN